MKMSHSLSKMLAIQYFIVQIDIFNNTLSNIFTYSGLFFY